jgi:transposase InsO family protein
MQIKRIGYGIRGFGRITSYAIRWTRMVTEQAKKRARIISFLEKHGVEAAQEAFSISTRTLFRWRAALRTADGNFEALNVKSSRPQHVRRRLWSVEVVAEIRRTRTAHPNLGKEKLHRLLVPWCDGRRLPCPSVATIGRLIADAPDKMRTFPVKVRHSGELVSRKRPKKDRKPKHFRATHPGHCVAFDTVERIIDGCRRYVITATDCYSRFSLAVATASHASAAATEFFTAIRACFPYRIEYVLTDNGSEFMKHFDIELRRLHQTHWHTFPRTPKMNAHVERFNRTLQEEFVDYHAAELLEPSSFNRALADWLIWYNAERPHWSLGLKSPIQFLTEQYPQECQRWWADTQT